VTCLIQESDAPFGLIDEHLKQAGRREVVAFVDCLVRLASSSLSSRNSASMYHGVTYRRH
jgi:hypothetical protein